jgi:GTP-binding protein LepA
MKKIRNFSIISHVDHGKSTLADRFLELTETVEKRKMQPQYLDLMDLEREKGITIKMQPVRMVYRPSQIRNPKSEIRNNLEIRNSKLEIANSEYILNLIDTPGHVDFSYEVSRSLAAVEGAVLLVDATKGVQAQTLANLELAKKQNLVIIPVINKIDSPQARIKETEKEISDWLDVSPSDIFKISAKEGTNVKEVLNAIVEKIPPPTDRGETSNNLLRALIFDSKYDSYKGVVAFIRIFEGKIKKGEKIYLLRSKTRGEAKEVGVFRPQLFPKNELVCGEIGYLATGIKETEKVRVGETITLLGCQVSPLPGYREPNPMVFLSIFPEDSNDFDLLKEGLEKLKLNDAALVFKSEMKEGLGRGFQTGFLGLLHAEIVTERLKREFGLDLVLSTPQVLYKILTINNKEILVRTPVDWPETGSIKESFELWVELEVLTPLNYLGRILNLLESIDSEQVKTNYLGKDKAELIYQVPLREIISKNFYDKVKTVSQGFASINYKVSDWRKVDLVKLDILILGRKEEPLSQIVPEKEAQRTGRRTVEKLKELLPPQLFSLPLQAVVGGKIIARETIKARRRDVTAPLYGGDYTRKRKLLEKQKKGKEELKVKGRVQIPSQVFLEMFRG